MVLVIKNRPEHGVNSLIVSEFEPHHRCYSLGTSYNFMLDVPRCQVIVLLVLSDGSVN